MPATTDSANFCEPRFKYSGDSAHSFTKTKVIVSKRNRTRTVLTKCSWCGRVGKRVQKSF